MKTHARYIYRKSGVHGRQGLVELIEELG